MQIKPLHILDISFKKLNLAKSFYYYIKLKKLKFQGTLKNGTRKI